MTQCAQKNNSVSETGRRKALMPIAQKKKSKNGKSAWD